MKPNTIIWLIFGSMMAAGAIISISLMPSSAASGPGHPLYCSHEVIQPSCAKCDKVVVEPNDPNTFDYVWDSNDTSLSVDTWDFATYSDITVATDKRTVVISLLGVADCNDREISRFADFMQLVTASPFASYDPNVYEVLVDRLVSPKLITSDTND